MHDRTILLDSMRYGARKDRKVWWCTTKRKKYICFLCNGFKKTHLEVIRKAQTHSDITKAIKKKRRTIIEFGKTLSELERREYLARYFKNRNRKAVH